MAFKYRRLSSFLTASIIFRASAAAVLGAAAFLVSSDVIDSKPEVGSPPVPTIQRMVRPAQPSEASEVVAAVRTDEQRLDIDDGVQGGQFGFSVAVEGSTAVIGAPGDAENRGAAYVYDRTGEGWTLRQKLSSHDAAIDDHFGWDVAVSGDTIVVGSYDLNEVEQGAAYIFTLNSGVWHQDQKLTPAAGTVSDQFGSSVAISGDTAIVGAFGSSGYRGAAYVFIRNGGIWTEQQSLSGSDTVAEDEFGWSVSISSGSAIVGAPRKQSAKGAAYVFTRSGDVWSEQQKITASDGSAFDQFGYSVAIDTDTAIVGAVMDGSGDTSSGSAYVFERSGAAWSQVEKLAVDDAAKNDKFGESVSIAGSSAVIGANGRDVDGMPDLGAAYVFGRSSSGWTLKQELSPSDPNKGDNFGGSVAVDSGAAVVGSHLKDIGGLALPTIDHGAAYSFALPVESVTVSGRVLSAQGNAVRGANVILTDIASGKTSTFTTAQLGFFTFSNVTPGRTYRITVTSKRYRYKLQEFELAGARSDLEFVGVE